MKYDYENNKVISCIKCDISISRKHIVNGYGSNIKNGIMFIGEGPGYYEDKYGYPFVGNSGTLFNKMLHYIGLERSDVYVTNVLKCRTPNNRDPKTVEINNCIPYLRLEILNLNPKIIVFVGKVAFYSYFGNNKLSMSRIKGKQIKVNNKIMIPIYHPAYILRNIDNETLVKEYFNHFVTIGKLYKEHINPLITFNF